LSFPPIWVHSVERVGFVISDAKICASQRIPLSSRDLSPMAKKDECQGASEGMSPRLSANRYRCGSRNRDGFLVSVHGVAFWLARKLRSHVSAGREIDGRWIESWAGRS
jgi:hypothetical protein